MLLSRKFCLVFVTIMYSGNPMFQASLGLTVMIIAYSLHVKFLPFVEPGGSEPTPAAGPALMPLTKPNMSTRLGRRSAMVISGRRGSVFELAQAARDNVVQETKRQIFHLNVLEATMLRSAIAVLVSVARSAVSLQQ